MDNKINYEEYTLLLGRGFALNVYLPALLAINCKKILLTSSVKKYINNDYISQYVKWIDDEEIINNKFLKIIIALPPEKQYSLICDMSLWKNSNNLILEKPIADNYKKAQYLINILNKSKTKYSINYSFRYTKWFADIFKYIHKNQSKGDIYITWRFKGRHLNKKESTWKTDHLHGGGVIKYYGIHLIAILSDIGYSDVTQSNIFNHQKKKLTSWSSEFISSTKLPKLNLSIDSYANENRFCWQQLNDKIIDIDTPFSLESSEYNGDNRIPSTIKFLQEEYNELVNYKNMNVLELWCKIESMI
tara:strand:+ start:105 stop:1013 length:909 start_codon:yes stop_codon:yes gene_type:complete